MNSEYINKAIGLQMMLERRKKLQKKNSKKSRKQKQ